jgi:translocator protein
VKSTVVSWSFVGVTIAYALLANAWTGHEPGWYASLNRPWFQPPDIVFGLMWPLNFSAVGIVGFILGRDHAGRAVVVLAVYVVSVGAALTWAYLFYVPHRLETAAIALGCAAALTWMMTALTASTTIGLGAALVPYSLWLTGSKCTVRE